MRILVKTIVLNLVITTKKEDFSDLKKNLIKNCVFWGIYVFSFVYINEIN